MLVWAQQYPGLLDPPLGHWAFLRPPRSSPSPSCPPRSRRVLPASPPDTGVSSISNHAKQEEPESGCYKTTNLFPERRLTPQFLAGALGRLGSRHLDQLSKELRLVHVVDGILGVVRVLELDISKAAVGLSRAGRFGFSVMAVSECFMRGETYGMETSAISPNGKKAAWR